MSTKISDFFTKKSIKIEPNEVKPKVISCNIDDEISVKLELKNSFPILSETSSESLQNLTTNINSGQSKINENIKTEAEKQLLVILPQQKIQKLPVPIKVLNKEPKNGKIKCQICDKNYSSRKSMLSHVRNIHVNPGRYKCEICKVGFNAKGNLDAHQKVHIKDGPKSFKCSKCDFTADKKSTLNDHLKTHKRIIERCDKCNVILIENRIHDCRSDCKYCGKEFKLSASVTNHIKYFHAHEIEGSIYECDICGLKFYHKIYSKIHLESKHADGKIHLFTCDLDGKTFKIKQQLNQHMKTHLQPIKCDFCHLKVSVRMLKGHIKNSHTGFKQPRKKYILKNKNFQCQICCKILSTKPCLNRHIKDHNKTIKCKFCEKLFGTQSKLREHIRDYHENPEGYICNICGRKFVQHGNLKIHLKLHDQNRPRDLKCSQCDYATHIKTSLKIHLNSHKRKDAKIAAIRNPHKCPQCPSVFERQKLLNGHIRKVHPKVLIECDICGRKMKVKSAILKHLKFVHKKDL